MTLPIGAPREWNGQFEEALFLDVARRHRPDFPAKLATPPREPRNDDELAAVADYYTKMASHDLFIVQVVAKAIDTLFRDDPHFQLILSRQLGDDGAHAVIGRERVTELTGVTRCRKSTGSSPRTGRASAISRCATSQAFAFEWHYELHILAKLWIQRKTGRIGDSAMREHGENRIRPDEEWHRVQIVQWWFDTLKALPAAERDALIDRVIAADEETQARLDGYLHDEYAHTAHVFGADIAEYRAIYDDWRREILSRLTGRQLDALVRCRVKRLRRKPSHERSTRPGDLRARYRCPAFDHAALARAIDALRTAAPRGRSCGTGEAVARRCGLLTLAVPRAFGGQEAAWPGIYDAIRQIARVGALAHLVGFQCLQVVSVDVGNAAQRERYLRGTVEQWWWGNAVNPLDTRLVVGPRLTAATGSMA